MEEITERLSYVKLAPQKSDAFLRAFEKVVAYASELRGDQLSDAEIDVTRRLAGPFTCGRLLILLIEPRQQHPWRQGIHTVILDCATLNALREGVHIGSNGALSLADDVSVLDLRPFVWAGLKDRLEEGQLVKLYDLVIEAISAKRPDTILRMGNVRHQSLVEGQ
ncbi:hypothetical protein IFM58399_05771 [Aspergillus lentulus]|uniref:Uncharacterized protein n=1 Tax=Aspergillus lentulus TaxID=293939 RepID=A0AAN5YWF5_ASPLE|nr:uncharacterized protein IFM58399_05771 [Aspergillus lentulus]KAF4155519.1 hypothetical protein CNMCM6069_007927 [Aspergillus lentulus]KAF4167396.1 hypothetical protein CNMCM6936_005353 [Aspergillus lentulus]KAF4179016.1 hypothetical protein CNMCM8060_003776 [Aspergillus lentulus]KAF4188565.1 hypothetical protein CNMCM7927_001260 [Aspergillus lentulus]KAF4193623.1 hypothetical protein CNMCM8694_008595 [Aspergillus lentulus]